MSFFIFFIFFCRRKPARLDDLSLSLFLSLSRALTVVFSFLSYLYLQLFTMLDKFLKLLDATTKKVSEKQARIKKMAKAKAAKAARAKAKEKAAAGR